MELNLLNYRFKLEIPFYSTNHPIFHLPNLRDDHYNDLVDEMKKLNPSIHLNNDDNDDDGDHHRQYKEDEKQNIFQRNNRDAGDDEDDGMITVDVSSDKLLFVYFRNILKEIWKIWEILLTCQPIIVISPFADISSDFVLALTSLISPVLYFFLIIVLLL